MAPKGVFRTCYDRVEDEALIGRPHQVRRGADEQREERAGDDAPLHTGARAREKRESSINSAWARSMLSRACLVKPSHIYITYVLNQRFKKGILFE
jgi:hypothetical protein